MRKKILSLILLGILCSIGSVWGGELFSTDFVNDWSNATLVTNGEATLSTTTYPKELFVRANGSKYTVSITDNGLTFAGNLAVNNNIAGIKISGINGEINVSLSHTYNNKKPTFRYYFVSGATSFSSSVSGVSYSTSTAPSSNGGNSTIHIENISDTEGVLYIGAASSSYYSIAGITITTPDADTEAPTLSTSNPANSATDVAVSGNITLTFSENVTINDDTKFSLTGGAGSLGTISASDNIVTIPYSGLAYSTEYTLSTAAGAVKDAANNTNAALSDISFTTKAATLYTVTFDAGSNGTCATESLTEGSVGAGVTLPSVTANAGYVFNGWYTASSEGDKVGDAGANYKPTANTTLYAQYRAKSSACKLTEARFSNGFFGEITQPSGSNNGTIKVYYLLGTSEPTLNNATVSDGATYVMVGSDLTVTSEDEVNTSVYDVTFYTKQAYSGVSAHDFVQSDIAFVEAPYNNGTISTEAGKVGWKMIQPSTEERKYNGNARVTIFLAPSSSVTFTTGSGNKRYLNVYRNLTKVETDYEFAATSGTLTITGDEDNPYIIVLEQSKTGGDAAIKAINVTKTGFESGIITAAGWNTFSSSSKLDLSQVTGGTAYVASAAEGTTVKLEPVTDEIVAAGAGLMIKGTANAAFKIATTSENATFSGTNLLVGLPNGGTVAAGNNNYVFGWTDAADPGFYYINSTEPTLDAGKAYLHAESLGTAAGRIRIVEEENNATGIEAAEAKDEAVKFFENGQLFIMRNGVVYDVTGRVVR